MPNENSTVWFTADTHFGHQRTLELSRRPFANVKEMDRAMVDGWNKSVKKNDVIYHLGDFGSPLYLKHLGGKQIMFLIGNYDNPDVVSKMLMDERVSVIASSVEVKLNGHIVRLIHRPEDGVYGIGNFFLFGHIHKLQKVKSNGLNVGVDCHYFKPINENTVLFYRNAILSHYDKNVFMEIANEGIFANI